MNNNILIISDLHSPFIKEGYLEHCKNVYKKYKCNKVIFIGDILDNHYSSYHETDPDGYSANDELTNAIELLQPWYKAFPIADICIGNHDRIIDRKAKTFGLSSRWIKSIADVLHTPKGWTFAEHFEYDNVLYYHGENSTGLLQTLLGHRCSIVCGHTHSKFELVYNASQKDLIFGLHVGCGIDWDKYAFEYAKYDVKKPIIGCAVVLNNGTLPILEPMIII
jgi:predicted phosphodiesterase